MGNRQCIDFFKGPLTVKLETGFIENRKEDVIVNSAAEDLDLQRNASAKALAASAGPQLQQECSKLAPLQIGEAQFTQAYNLKCKRVLHCNFGEKYNGKESEKELKRGIMRCLNEVNQSGEYKSIAFSAIGTGGLKFPDEVVAGCIIKCLEDFISENIAINLNLVSIVIAPNNPFTYKSFAKIFKEQNSTDESRCSLVTIDEESEEFQEVMVEFLRTFDTCATVLQIQKVNNEQEWEKYKNWREHVSKKNQMSEKEVERYLWHGTKEDTVSKIAKFSFNRSYAGVNGTKYGVGTYFARDSSKSAKYTSPNRSNERHMIRARVITGNYTLGQKNLVDAPMTSTGDKYDSVVDNEVDPSIYVVFHDNAAYPQYVIKYTNSPQQKQQDADEEQLKSNTTRAQHYTKLMLVLEELKITVSFMERLERDSNDYAIVPVDRDNEEFLNVWTYFQKTRGSSIMKVLEIQRVQNFAEWEKFKRNRDIISKRHSVNSRGAERLLWHGTSEETVEKISKFSFNRSYSREGKLGKGCYFARDSCYSAQDKYSVPNKAGHKFVILARVVVGQYTTGNKQLKDAPENSIGYKFDSVVDDVENPSVFVVFQDAAAYPEYIIKFVK